MWVPHLGWVHTLTAPPTDPRPAPSTGGREQAAPPPRPDNLCIPPHDGLEAWESGTARSRGHNLTSLAAHYPETARAAPPPRERDSGTIAMIVLENGNYYYQVRIIPHPQESHWSLEAVDSMLQATTDLPDSPTPLLPGQPPDPLKAIVSGTAGTWHPATPSTASGGGRGAAGRTPGRGQRLGGSTSTAGCRWRQPRHRRQKPPLRPTCAPSSRSTRSGHWHWASNCSPPSALRQRPRRRTRPWCTKTSVPSAAPLCDAWVTPQGPEPRPATGPAATTHGRTRTTRVPHRPRAGEETKWRTWDRLLPPEGRTMIVTPTAAGSATNHNDLGRADLAQKDPLVQPNNARPRNTLWQHLSTGHTSGEGVHLPGTRDGHPRSGG